MDTKDEDDKYHRYRYRDPSAPKNHQKAPTIWFSKRFFVVVLLFLGYLMHGIICQVIGITLSAMTTNETVIISENQATNKTAEFNWDPKIVEMILNTFWIGFLFSICGGFVAQKHGGAKTLGISMMLTGGILTLNPTCARIHYYIFALCQAIAGVLQSFFLVGTAEIFACWMPMKERPVLVSFVINGMYVGAVIMHPFCSNLAYKWKWSMNFYVLGIVCFMWSIVWLIFVKNEPMKDKRISEKEFEYIWQHTGTLLRKRDIQPYTDILASIPCWALFFSKFAFGWGSAFTLAYLPLNYIKDVTNNWTNIQTNEVYFILLILEIVSVFTIPIAGLLVNFWQNTGDRILTRVHKIIIGFVYLIAGFSFLAFALLINHFSPSVICFVAIKPLLSYSQVILEMIPVHMAPNHSCLLSGFAVFWQTVGILSIQTIVKGTVKDHKLNDWNIFFLSSAAVLISSAVMFSFFGSSELQTWSSISQSRNRDENQRGQYKELIKLSGKANVCTTEPNDLYEEKVTDQSISFT